MPLPMPGEGEGEQDFISRCVHCEGAIADYPEESKRLVECHWEWELKDPDSIPATEGWIWA